MDKKFNNTKERLNLIMDNIVLSIQSGQEEIFEISELMRRELEEIQENINNYEQKIQGLNQEIELLSLDELKKREILSKVSKEFWDYGEEDIREAYEIANETHIQLILKKEERKSVEQKIVELRDAVLTKQGLIYRAERLMLRIKSVIDFLITDLTYVGDKMTSLEEQTKIGIKIIKIQEEERRKIARDIHDGPAQDIASLIIKGDIVEKLLKKHSDEASEELKKMKEHLRKVLKDIRSIMYDLRPTMLDDLGLAAAVSSMANYISEENKVDVGVQDVSKYDIKSPAVGLVVYRIIQESLNNAVKHANANHISIKIDVQKDKIEGIIVDDGCGFDMKEKPSSKTSSFGLSSMKERANIIQGDVRVESKKGKGTKVMFTIPNEGETYEN